MSTTKITVRPMGERRYGMVLIALIDVPNSRRRNEERFKEIRRSIEQVGLQKPICVNERNLKETGRYELVCGEGRLEACRQLGMTHIEAEIINADYEYTLLGGLAENLTRTKKDVIDFAKRLLEMSNRGMTNSDLARITGKSTTTIADYITLVKNGEESLIRAIEDERISITFAMEVIENPEEDVQKYLLKARLDGQISNQDLKCITKLLKERKVKVDSNTADTTYTELKSAIKAETQEQKRIYSQSKIKRDDAIFLTDCLKLFWSDKTLREKIDKINLPKLELSEKYGL
jgi:ParB family chromosome partitioning protein